MTDEKKKPENGEVSEEKLEKVSGGKLTLGKATDKLEQEADDVADKVSR